LRPDAEARAYELYQTQLTSPSEAIFLAELNGDAIGLVRCVDSVSSPLLYPDRYCYVSSAYVLPSMRRRGVLRALVERAVQWCGERGIDEIRLHNAVSSPEARQAWETLGFEVVEQVRRRALGDRPRHPTPQPLSHAEAR
ncbi:MAG TPA: GNAT family N-acetyltransferase, partial [Gemmatimonadales bacterium]